MASDLSQLRAGLDRPEKEAGAPRDEPSGWDVQFQPASLRGLSRMDARRVMAGLEALGCDRATCRVGLENDALAMRLTIHLEAPAAEVPALDPAWLQPIPAFDLVGVVSFALASKGETVGTLFAMLDRIEKADPARAGVAPLRTRLNLLAASAKVFPDTDLWPHLRGVSVALSAGPDGKLSGLLVLQTNDPEAAERIASKVVPRLASRLFGRNPAESVLQAKVRGSVVIVGWGRGAIEASLDTLEHPERSVAATIRGRWGKAMPQRAGAFWPGRLPGILPADSPFAVALREASPVVWAGRIQGKAHQDEVRWGGLDRVVKRWLEGLPLKPPTVD